MKNEFIFIIIILFTTTYQQLSETYKYNIMPGIQVYLFKNDNAYSYITLNGNSEQMIGEVYLYLTKSIQDIINDKVGVYVAIGFGSNTMVSADVVICQYFVNTTETYRCSDWWSKGDPSPNRAPKVDASYNGQNDVVTLKGNIAALSTKFAPYNTIINFQFIKQYNDEDKTADWKDFKTWLKNGQGVIGAYGVNRGDGISRHSVRSPTNLLLKDGSGCPVSVAEPEDDDFIEFYNNTKSAFIEISLVLYIFFIFILNVII
jgi:hypothetical protein